MPSRWTDNRHSCDFSCRASTDRDDRQHGMPRWTHGQSASRRQRRRRRRRSARRRPAPAPLHRRALLPRRALGAVGRRVPRARRVHDASRRAVGPLHPRGRRRPVPTRSGQRRPHHARRSAPPAEHCGCRGHAALRHPRRAAQRHVRAHALRRRWRAHPDRLRGDAGGCPAHRSPDRGASRRDPRRRVGRRRSGRLRGRAATARTRSRDDRARRGGRDDQARGRARHPGPPSLAARRRHGDRMAHRAPRPAGRPRDRPDACPPRRRVDPREARPRREHVTVGVRRAVHHARRRTADALPRRLATRSGPLRTSPARTTRSRRSRPASATPRRPRSAARSSGITG